MSARVAVIGAGMAGVTCARGLADSGFVPVVFDKGRSVGGRMATRVSRSGWQFDHGAQFVTAREPGFAALLEAMERSGSAGRWPGDAAEVRWVGRPDMAALVRYLADGLDVRPGVAVEAIAPHGNGWRVTHDRGSEDVARVVVTVPAPQVAGLLGADHPLVAALDGVELAPCHALMAGLAGDAPRPFVTQRDDAGALAWIAQDSSKPGRQAETGTAWVAHASPLWSAANLERDKDEVAEAMLPLLLERLGAERRSVQYVAAHRWRYARVTSALGRSFLRSECGTLYLGGDWCVGPRVEAAWTSGRAIARDLVGQ